MRRYAYVKKRYAFLFGLIDAAGYFIFNIFKAILPRGVEPGGEVKRIAVIELAHLGDVLVATPAIRLLRKKFPGAHIAVVVSPWSEDIITGNPDIDEVVRYRASWFDRIEKKHFSLKETLGFIRTLRRGSFDLGIDMRCDVRVILLMWLGRIKYRVGYGFTGGGFLLSKVVPFDVEKRQDRHQIDHNIDLVKAAGPGKKIDGIDRRMAVYFSDADQRYIDGYLRANSITKEDFLIAIQPGTGLPSKSWPVEKFDLLVGKILKTHKVKIILVGGPQETHLGDKIAASGHADLVNAIGRTSIKQLMALLKRCRLFIGANSGLMHFASAAGAPIIAIWSGRSRPSLWRPLSEEAIIIDKPLEDIGVEDVLSGVSEHLNRQGGS